MPSAGYFHSYEHKVNNFAFARYCVNALGGLFPFLHIRNPVIIAMIGCVSMPSAGYFHSYTPSRLQLLGYYIMCQCPRRAISILTVPSGNPHKYWLSNPIFACICLNILKTCVFPLFLGLFIICSYLDAFYTSSDTINIILYLPI